MAELVLNGEKQGTTSLDKIYGDGEEKPKGNDYSIITNFEGEAKCIIKTIEVKRMPLGEVTEEMAYLEGKGNKTLDYWKKTHNNCFDRYCCNVGKIFNNKDLIIYEHFELVYKNK